MWEWMQKLGWKRALAIALTGLVVARGLQEPDVIVHSWLPDRWPADSTARAIEALTGVRPTALAACGPGHLMMSLTNVPRTRRPRLAYFRRPRPGVVPGTDAHEAYVLFTLRALLEEVSELRADTFTVVLRNRTESLGGVSTTGAVFTFAPPSRGVTNSSPTRVGRGDPRCPNGTTIRHLM